MFKVYIFDMGYFLQYMFKNKGYRVFGDFKYVGLICIYDRMTPKDL